ncbi:MAG: hypothetical protein E4H20_10370 [Spirochaetales bacterium]|nr:MAG: hypothetical protein E4H20_10370 [Spirochaetales bacterium]
MKKVIMGVVVTAIGFFIMSCAVDPSDGVIVVLEAPTGVSASDTILYKVTISWNSVPDAVAYYIFRSLSPNADYSEIGLTTGVSYEDISGIPGTTYYYKVQARSAYDIFSDYSEYDQGQALATPTGPGTCSMLPESITIDLNDAFTTEIHVDTGSMNIAAYDVDVLFDPTTIQVNTGEGTNGVQASADGFVSAVNASSPGVLQISGLDASGKGPDNDFPLVTINWTAVGAGTAAITLEVEVLVDSSYATIGTPAGIGNTITVN